MNWQTLFQKFALLLVIIFGTESTALFAQAVAETVPVPDSKTASETAPVTPPALEALFGGTFELLDHQGSVRRDSDWPDKLKLIFFGYTHCPAICPTSLNDISEALDLLGNEADLIQPLFITVDPERDRPVVLADYISSFHPSLIGLSGTEEQVAAVSKKFRVQRHKILLSEEDHSAHSEHSDGHGGAVNYDAAHSSLTYLMDTEGKFLTIFPYDTGANVMAQRLKVYLEKSR
ncbi:SCO family protein [Kiloniella laminariae]|uniref:SCO family protein n=1 Tax=Kiloniella laminariae TaxID=454162 RepID=A0ABT4LE45_9PROT|nr:SCO family protein [Kiloniella laminariae]MCZ4279371.1 SCO family protein [Kiloniella laminariae]